MDGEKAKSGVAGIILAAGASTRMGRPKQLLDVGHQTLLDRILGEALKSDLDSVVLVLGHEMQLIKNGLRTNLENPKLRIIENKHYKEGISTSIIAGFSEVQNSHDHCMIILADMPHITASLINHFISIHIAPSVWETGQECINCCHTDTSQE